MFDEYDRPTSEVEDVPVNDFTMEEMTPALTHSSASQRKTA